MFTFQKMVVLKFTEMKIHSHAQISLIQSVMKYQVYIPNIIIFAIDSLSVFDNFHIHPY